MDEVARDLTRGGAPSEDPVHPDGRRGALLETRPTGDEEGDLPGRVGLAEG